MSPKFESILEYSLFDFRLCSGYRERGVTTTLGDGIYWLFFRMIYIVSTCNPETYWDNSLASD